MPEEVAAEAEADRMSVQLQLVAAVPEDAAMVLRWLADVDPHATWAALQFLQKTRGAQASGAVQRFRARALGAAVDL